MSVTRPLNYRNTVLHTLYILYRVYSTLDGVFDTPYSVWQVALSKSTRAHSKNHNFSPTLLLLHSSYHLGLRLEFELFLMMVIAILSRPTDWCQKLNLPPLFDVRQGLLVPAVKACLV